MKIKPSVAGLSLLLLYSLLLFAGCRQMRELKALSKCEFRFGGVHDLNLVGIRLDNMRSASDLKLMDAAKVAAAYATGALRLDLVADIDVRNPNDKLAALNRVAWIALLDGNEVLDGVVTQRIEVPANNGTATIPLAFGLDLKKVLSGKSKESLERIIFGINDKQTGKPSTLKLKIKPSFMVGKKNINYPGYITLKKQFSSK